MIIDGKSISEKIKAEVKTEVENLKKEGINPSLSVILVGNDPSSAIYVKNKGLACEKVGILSNTYRLPENAETKDVIELVEALNYDKKTNGILVQVPMPPQIDEEAVLKSVSAEKDVDGFHIINAGLLYLNRDGGFIPCTANGIIALIKSTGETIDGKTAVVVGRSMIVGKPVAQLLMKENATVTVCHTHTKNLKAITSAADILVVAAGKKHLITKDMVKRGAIVIDVGITRENGKLFGDVDFDEVKNVAAYVTPVPGGVGPMTIAMLLKNTVIAAKRQGK